MHLSAYLEDEHSGAWNLTRCLLHMTSIVRDRVSLVQGRPLHVKHDARCVMVKVGGEAKKGKRGGKVTKFKKC